MIAKSPMMRRTLNLSLKTAGTILLAAAFWFALSASERQATASDARRKAPPIGSCINLAGALEAPREGDWGYVIRDKDLTTIAEAGFEAIRLPVKWSSHAAYKAPYQIDPAFLKRVDHIIDLALANGMRVVLDMHHYDELYDDPDRHEARFAGMWAQLAEHYKGYSNDKLLFELINEPRGKFSGSRMSDAQNRVLAMVRKTNPKRTVVLSGDMWGNFPGINNLFVPDDPHVMVSVHYYDPFSFTHQGANWLPEPMPIGSDWGRENEIKKLARFAEALAKWQESHNAPIFLGEFGAIERARDSDRAIWTAGVRAALDSVQIPWCSFDFANGFSAYDRRREAWRPLLLNALIPQGGQPEAGS